MVIFIPMTGVTDLPDGLTMQMTKIMMGSIYPGKTLPTFLQFKRNQ